MDILTLPGVGASRAKLLQEMGITTINDLVTYYPRDYSDRSQISTIADLTLGTINTIRCTITKDAESVSFKSVLTKLVLEDETGRIELIWFGQPYLKKVFKKGETYLFTGKVSENYGRLQMESPEYEPANQPSAPGIVPIYTLPKGLSQKMFRKWMKAAIAQSVPDEAICTMHFPKNSEAFHTARRQLVFEELFSMQLALLQLKGAPKPGVQINIEANQLVTFCNRLPFSLTNSQLMVLDDIKVDLQSGLCMNRLVQGDVGSGKTVIAAAAAYWVISSGYQVALMAPTEVLARQHFKKLQAFFSESTLLVGTLTAKEKREALSSIAEGHAKLVVGTHALIQDGVTFNNLALVITDEQHRFGVNQRAALAQKSDTIPHVMIMTATPIPRTLGLILYGDMDISIIDSLPPGRQPIKTYCVNSGYRSRLIAFMQKQVNEGRQVYVICPAIEESEKNAEAQMNTVIKYTTNLQKALPNIPIACLHGRLKNKEEILTAFANNEYGIIVSTTVIEVGVDVPNATLIVIENAERFGLSQLHQLRGRVGRGVHQSYCVLVTDTKANHTKERMQAMESTSDGFVLAELDLKQRGPGDFFGTMQHGMPEFRVANLYRDIDVLKEVQKAIKKDSLK